MMFLGENRASCYRNFIPKSKKVEMIQITRIPFTILALTINVVLAESSFSVSDNRISIPSRLQLDPIDPNIMSRMEKILNCASEAKGQNALDATEEELNQLAGFTDYYYQSAGAYISGNRTIPSQEQDRIQSKYSDVKEVLDRIADSRTAHFCFLTDQKENEYHEGAPKICSDLFPYLDPKSLSKLYSLNGEKEFVYCEGNEPVSLKADRLSSAVSKVRDEMISERVEELKKELKELALDKLLKKRKNFDGLSGENENLTNGLNICKKVQGIKLQEPVTRSARNEKEVKKLVLSETLNALVVKASLKRDKIYKDFVSNSQVSKSTCIQRFSHAETMRARADYNPETSLVPKDCYGVPFEGESIETYSKKLEAGIQENLQRISQSSSSLGKAVSSRLESSDFLFDLNENYDTASGDGMLDESNVTKALTKNASSELMTKLASALQENGTEENMDKFFSENSSSIAALIEKNLKDSDVLNGVAEGMKLYRDDMTESANNICKEDIPELHLMDQSFEDIIKRNPRFRNGESESLITQMAWCKLHQDYPPGEADKTMLSMGLSAIGALDIPLGFAGAPGRGIVAAKDASEMMVRYNVASDSQSRSRGFYHTSYGDLKDLREKNSELEGVEADLLRYSLEQKLDRIGAGRVNELVAFTEDAQTASATGSLDPGQNRLEGIGLDIVKQYVEDKRQK